MKIPKKLTHKNIILIELVGLGIIALRFTPFSEIWLQVLIAVFTSAILDICLIWYRKKLFYFPESAIITSLIISYLLAPNTIWYITVIAPSAAITSKHFINLGNRHIFNPANLGILIAATFLGANITWWGASDPFILIIFGLYLAYRMRRFLLPGIFLIVYFVLLFITTPNPDVPSLFLVDFAVFFFVFIMLPEPQTSPVYKNSRYIYAGLTALLAVIFSLLSVKVPFNSALFFANLVTPIIHNLEKRKK